MASTRRTGTSCSWSTSTSRCAGPWPSLTSTTRLPPASQVLMSRTARSMSPRYSSAGRDVDGPALDRAGLPVDVRPDDLAQRVPQRRVGRAVEPVPGGRARRAVETGPRCRTARRSTTACPGRGCARGRRRGVRYDAAPRSIGALPPPAAAAHDALQELLAGGDQVVRPAARPLGVEHEHVGVLRHQVDEHLHVVDQHRRQRLHALDGVALGELLGDLQRAAGAPRRALGRARAPRR